ncbi:hypothetical protein B0T21DRAFT_414552 [Apiosordaria backusii]|uniref:Uncharacterized protein n=1 Tax=Apiosordaria backusii TaxID=314023 RepID=A0AA40ASV0_9PEZI|nr:hypothetical protein B0T21DRAFT_414552 [Apiosordaria backusii]
MASTQRTRKDWPMYPLDSDFFPWPQMRKYFLPATSGTLGLIDLEHYEAVALDRYCDLRVNHKQYTLQAILDDVVELKDAVRAEIMKYARACEELERVNWRTREPEKQSLEAESANITEGLDYTQEEAWELLVQCTFYGVMTSVIEADRDEDRDWVDLTQEAKEARVKVKVEREIGFLMVDRPNSEESDKQTSPQGRPSAQKERRSTLSEWMERIGLTEQLGGAEAIEKAFPWIHHDVNFVKLALMTAEIDTLLSRDPLATEDELFIVAQDTVHTLHFDGGIPIDVLLRDAKKLWAEVKSPWVYGKGIDRTGVPNIFVAKQILLYMMAAIADGYMHGQLLNMSNIANVLRANNVYGPDVIAKVEAAKKATEKRIEEERAKGRTPLGDKVDDILEDCRDCEMM